ncbi:hypothetical protein GCM10011610_45300 [Nocardia rhizosphaerihabitans]|uniref:Uncharacterized protein n=1 Tax=Nocardia rhizosphaerihabitans TaxID=1691570 RepID=A0ABQ2KPG1_9NOCA|nr:hypothetical protein GCM10011610_45300 [Nocardia rhizosphaerihabitans]
MRGVATLLTLRSSPSGVLTAAGLDGLFTEPPLRATLPGDSTGLRTARGKVSRARTGRGPRRNRTFLRPLGAYPRVEIGTRLPRNRTGGRPVRRRGALLGKLT